MLCISQRCSRIILALKKELLLLTCILCKPCPSVNEHGEKMESFSFLGDVYCASPGAQSVMKP